MCITPVMMIMEAHDLDIQFEQFLLFKRLHDIHIDSS